MEETLLKTYNVAAGVPPRNVNGGVEKAAGVLKAEMIFSMAYNQFQFVEIVIGLVVTYDQ